MSRGRVLVLGGSGFIGLPVATALQRAGWTVIAGARRPEAARRRAPALTWRRAEFAELQTAEAWAALLEGVDAVVNCVGVLQDAPGESTRAAHETGPAALFAACEAAGVRRVVHLSAVGADEAAGTIYARSKLATERALAATALDWIALRPSLVIARDVYGGTALMRGLAGFPGFIPVLGGAQRFRPVAMADLAGLIVRLLEAGAPSRRVLEVAGPDALSLAEMLRAYRGWLGLRPAPVIQLPLWAGWPALKAGDLAAWLGWSSSLRTTAVRQMAHTVEGDPHAWTEASGVTARPFAQALSDEPAGVQDRWHARLFFFRPLAVLTLALFWLIVGLVGLTAARPGAVALLEEAGFGRWSAPVSDLGHVFDLLMGSLLLIRPFTRRVALGMAVACAGYLLAGTWWLPRFWVDPLQPWLKVFPVIALALFVAATDDRR